MNMAEQPYSLELLISYIRILPERVLGDLKASGKLHLLPDGEALEILEDIKAKYVCRSQWFEFYLLDHTELESELFHTDKVFYKTDAEVDLALFKLIQELRPRSDWLQELGWSASKLWFVVLLSNCYRELSESGLTGSEPGLLPGSPDETGEKPLITSKKLMLTDARRTDKLVKKGRSFEGDPRQVDYRQHGESLVLADAAGIAESDRHFRMEYFNPYWKLRSRYWSEVETDDQMQLGFVDMADGKGFTTGWGKKKKQRASHRSVEVDRPRRKCNKLLINCACCRFSRLPFFPVFYLFYASKTKYLR